MPSLRRGAEASVPLSRAMRRFLLRGASPAFGEEGRWDILTNGSEARCRAAWNEHRRELMAEAHPNKPAAWFWFAAPPSQRWSVGALAADDDPPAPEPDDNSEI